MAIAIPLNELPVFSKSNPAPKIHSFSDGAAFLIDKPSRWTSFDVVQYIRKAIDIRKVGHAGTLDPMATGLLVVCCGRATKSISQFQELFKIYEAEITFGAETPSYDAETDIVERAPYEHITSETIGETLLESFAGEIQQVPPMYSAVKHKGKRLYKLARKGERVKRAPRSVVIHQTEILDYNPPLLHLRIKCSKGTYIRSLAADLGRELDSLGYLSALRRTAIGSYTVSDALSIQDLKEIKFSSLEDKTANSD